MLERLNKTLSGLEFIIYKKPTYDPCSTELNDRAIDAMRNTCDCFLKGRMTSTEKFLTFIILAYCFPDF